MIKRYHGRDGQILSMALDFRFGIISDLHIALPHTIWDHPSRFHLVEVSIPGLEVALEHLCQLDLDFLLLPGDLTQHGEPDNHTWLGQRLAQLPFPAYVIPGNHDIPHSHGNEHSIAPAQFPYYYQKFGYADPSQLYYTCELLPGVRLIALNSNDFDPEGRLVGRIDADQMAWLEGTLGQIAPEEVVLVMVHHNVVEHIRGQSQHPWGQRYIIENSSPFQRLLQSAGVQMVFTGHLHIQNIAYRKGVYDITTGSLVSYPHPYRILRFQMDDWGRQQLSIESNRIQSVPGWPTLQDTSREWMGSRSQPAMEKLLTSPPLELTPEQAQPLLPDLRYYWAQIAEGDATFSFPSFPPQAREYLERMNRSLACDPEASLCSDNHCTLYLRGWESLAISA